MAPLTQYQTAVAIFFLPVTYHRTPTYTPPSGYQYRRSLTYFARPPLKMCCETLRVYHCRDDMSPRFSYSPCHLFNGIDETMCPNCSRWDDASPKRSYIASRDCPECREYDARQRGYTRSRGREPRGV